MGWTRRAAAAPEGEAVVAAAAGGLGASSGRSEACEPLRGGSFGHEPAPVPHFFGFL